MKSKFKIFGGTGLVLALFCFAASMTFLMIFGNLEKGRSNVPEGFYIFSMLIGLIFLGYEIYRNLNFINFTSEGIEFKHAILQIKKMYKYEDLDGYIDQTQSAKGGSFHVLYLKQNQLKIKKISSFYFSNYEEMKRELKKHIKYLGHEEYKFFN